MTVENPVTGAGTKFYIGGIGALDSETGWVEIGEVITGGEFGKKFDKIDYLSLSSRKHRKLKGGYDNGSLTIELARIPSDAGQAVIQQALDSDSDYNFKVELNDAPSHSAATPSTYKFQAKVFSYTTNVQGANDVVKAAVMVEIDTDIEFTAAA